jgi:hypothetical protein
MKIEVTVSAANREHLVESLRLVADEVERELPCVTHWGWPSRGAWLL